MWEGIKQKADEENLNVTLFWPKAESDFNYQYEILKSEAFEYDAIILSPSNVDGVAKYLPPLKAANKTVIILGAGVKIPKTEDSNEYYDVFIGTDNEIGGVLVAEYIKNKINPGSKIILLGGFPMYMTKPGRETSFLNRVRSYHANISISEFVADYDRQKAFQVTENNIGKFMTADVIFCSNDHMALGVIDYFKKFKIKKKAIIIGYDSIREAQQEIVLGNLDASVIQFPAIMGREGVTLLSNSIKNRKKITHENIYINPELSLRKVTVDSIKLGELIK